MKMRKKRRKRIKRKEGRGCWVGERKGEIQVMAAVWLGPHTIEVAFTYSIVNSLFLSKIVRT